LIVGSIVARVLQRTARTEAGHRLAANVVDRVAAWWVLCAITAVALQLGVGAVCLLFALLSSIGLSEFAQHPRAPTAVLFAFTVAQYGAILGRWDGVFRFLIPVGGALVIPIWNLVAGKTGDYLERTAEPYWGLMVTTYCLSFAPALLRLDIAGYAGRNSTLVYYLLLVVQASDILQYVWGKLLGRRPVTPRISPNKTWEGLIGGILSATALGAVLYRATPFRPWQAAAICLATTLAGFAGGLTMSAIKRQRGIKDFGTLVMGHGGVLDRIDSLCFGAPVFFLLVRQFFT
jgi:phosphatidate cytidylyltransferase